MNSESWKRLEELFDRAMALPSDERVAFVEGECGDDEELRTELLKMLAAQPEGTARLEGVVSAAAADALTAEETPDVAGQQIGPYRVVEAIGSGGMGSVFLAERADDAFDKQVAIKLVRGGRFDEVGRVRFRNERQILADLEHPNIARLLDGGTTDDDVPYVVMEYVDGKPIDTFVAEHRLSVREILDLFLDVCRAVQHAHARLVVHRDLKPGNILVSADGTAKLLDFGIAKLVSPDDDASGQTRPMTSAALMTPEYASPEQVLGERVGTATDVYSLGVLLYRLLTGRLPHELHGRSAAEIVELVTTRDPERPSRVVEREETTSPADARSRGRGLAGDLDWIILTALRKEPDRRYRSVAHLADDIQRHLEGRPVAAGPNSIRYRTRKFVRRNRVPLMVAAAVVALTGYYVIQLAQERALARTEARKAERVADLMTDLFQIANPDLARGREVTARELLDSGAVRLRAELTDEPAVRADLMRVVGSVYQQLGHYDEAMSLLEESVEVALVEYGEVSEEVASALDAIGQIQSERGDLDSATALHRRVLAIRRAERPIDERDLVISLSRLAAAMELQGERDSSDAFHTEAVEVAAGLPGVTADSLSQLALNNRGLGRHRAGRYEEARADLEAALAIQRRILDAEHSAVSATLTNLGNTLSFLGELETAEAHFREAVRIYEARLDPEHPSVATGLLNLSNALKESGEFAEAERLLRRSIDIHLARSGEGSPRLQVAYNNLANLRQDQGDLEGALEYHERALSLALDLYGELSEQVATSYYNTANVHRSLGDLASALDLQERALNVDSLTLGPEHPFIVGDLRSIGTTLLAMGAASEAEVYFLRALALGERIHGDDHIEVGRTRNELARGYNAMDRPEEAVVAAREGLRVLELALGPDHWEVGATENILGLSLWLAGDREEAEPLLRRGYQTVRAVRGEANEVTRAALERLGTAGLTPDDP